MGLDGYINPPTGPKFPLCVARPWPLGAETNGLPTTAPLGTISIIRRRFGGGVLLGGDTVGGAPARTARPSGWGLSLDPDGDPIFEQDKAGGFSVAHMPLDRQCTMNGRKWAHQP